MGADLETDLAAEEQFGPYLVYERLGVGGMATVHRALERGIEGFERIVALKRLLPHLAEDASFIKSFVREAKLASLLNHHNIVQIYELGRVATEYFISMEYIDGRDIRRILRHARKVSGAPPIHVTVGILLQLSEALDYAHTKCDEQGQPLKLVHRDISPSNLIVNPTGHLKVIDFGIAKAQSSQLRTQTGRVKGKLAYMAPEAVTSGKDLDARSDLWAVGVIAHELLTARPLFARKNEYETLLKVQKSDIAKPSTFNESCPPELDDIVLKLLARDPDERYLDAAALREALIDLRRKLKLATSTRDIATWLDWAFSLETPGGFSQGTVDRSGSGAFDLQAAARSLSTMAAAHLTPTPKPRREDDEAVEIAWGGGDDQEVEGKPIELDDVPDVSAKFSAAAVRNKVKDPDFGDQHSDEHDDIPAPEPSHGVLRPKRDTDRSAAVPLPLPAPPQTPVPAPRERRSTAKGVSARPDTLDVPSGVLGVDRSHARALSEISAAALAEPMPRDTQPSVVPVVPVEPERPSEPPERKSLDDMVDDQLIATQPRPRRTPRDSRPSQSTISIGDAIVARESVRSRAWIWILALVVVGAGGAAYAMFLTGGDDAATQVADTSPAAKAGIEAKHAEPQQPEPKAQKGTLRFVVEPADVSISIEGVAQHEGSPWSLELPPGAHKVELRRNGYKPRVTSIELSPNETQTLLVTLEKAPRKIGRDMDSQATLILDSEPQGLEVIIDGRLISDRTPVTRVINAGPHVIALRQNGVEVWRQNLVAEADADHEFRPVFSEQKKRERRQRIVGNPSERAVETTDAAPPVDPPPDAPAKTETAPIAIAPTIELPPAPAPVPPPPAPKAKPVAVPHSGPIMVAPNAVRRVAGETPTLGASKPQNMPAVVAAKVCIDTTGAVSSIDIITKLERHTTVDLVSSMKAWRYAPYKQPDGTAVPACFSVNFRVK